MIKCKLCGGASQPLQYKELYHICGTCQLIWLDDSHVLPPGLEKGRYLEHNNDQDSTGYVKMFEDFLSQVEPWSRGESALDFGSGPGPVLADIMRKRGWRVDIYDPYFAPGQDCLKQEYNLITCTEVIEHVRHPLKVWQQLRNCLTPDGTLAVMTLFHPGLEGFEKWWYRRDSTHICFYNRVTMEWIAENLGLSLSSCDDVKTAIFTLAG